MIIYVFGFALLGYLCGSLPFAVWVTRLVKGFDVRAAGSHHATTTNVIRQAGWAVAVPVALLDAAKGFLPTWLALHYTHTPWIAALTAGSAVIGHCFPLFARFRGGMGWAPANGAMLATVPWAVLVCIGLLGLLTLVSRHAARASVVTAVLVAPVLYLLGQRGALIWIAAAAGGIIALRFLIDWNRKYKEVWLDRGKKNG